MDGKIFVDGKLFGFPTKTTFGEFLSIDRWTNLPRKAGYSITNVSTNVSANREGNRVLLWWNLHVPRVSKITAHCATCKKINKKFFSSASLRTDHKKYNYSDLLNSEKNPGSKFTIVNGCNLYNVARTLMFSECGSNQLANCSYNFRNWEPDDVISVFNVFFAVILSVTLVFTTLSVHLILSSYVPLCYKTQLVHTTCWLWNYASCNHVMLINQRQFWMFKYNPWAIYGMLFLCRQKIYSERFILLKKS